jgi:hypothetical protein
MDDMTLFHDDHRTLEDARDAIRDWLWSERRLELKSYDHTLQPTAQPSTFLGFRVSRSGLAPGPKAKRRLKQRLRRTEDLGTAALVRGLRAYRGMMLSIG